MKIWLPLLYGIGLSDFVAFIPSNFCTVPPDVFFHPIGSSRHKLDVTSVKVLKPRSTSDSYERVAAQQ
jgi:hypothetical protein